MAALNDSDLRKILGDNFRDKQDEMNRASGLDDGERANVARVDSLQGRKTSVIYTGVVGLVLVVAAAYSPTQQAMMIQTGLGLAVAVGCAATYFWLRAEVIKGRAKMKPA